MPSNRNYEFHWLPLIISIRLLELRSMSKIVQKRGLAQKRKREGKEGDEVDEIEEKKPEKGLSYSAQ